ncbi:MAG: hypothetical protein ACPL5F_05010 [Moorellaceae bacterium]
MLKRFVCILDPSLERSKLREVKGGYSFQAGHLPAGVPIIKFKAEVGPGDPVVAVFYQDYREAYKDTENPPDWAQRNVIHLHAPKPEDGDPPYRLLARVISKTGARTGLAQTKPVWWAVGETVENLVIVAVVPREKEVI